MREWITFVEAAAIVELRTRLSNGTELIEIAIKNGEVKSRIDDPGPAPERTGNLDGIGIYAGGPVHLDIDLDDGPEPEIFAASLDSWLARLTGQTLAVAPTTGKRKIDRSFSKADAPLVEKMRALMLSGSVQSETAAATEVVSEAVGGGTEESKIRRLQRAYSDRYGELRSAT